MAQNRLKDRGLSSFGRAESLLIARAFSSGKAADRQVAINKLPPLQGIDLGNVKSLRYDPALQKDGRNVGGDVMIGPSAFDQDVSWLATVILHEVVHADQFACYAKQGIQFRRDDAKTEGVRKLIALDEFEAFHFTWLNHRKLALSPQQVASLYREVRLWLIEIGDDAIEAAARSGKIDTARQLAIKGLP